MPPERECAGQDSVAAADAKLSMLTRVFTPVFFLLKISEALKSSFFASGWRAASVRR